MLKKIGRFFKRYSGFMLVCALGVIFGTGCSNGCSNENTEVGVPPTVLSVPKDKQIEVGTYSDFEADMKAIVVTDDNQEELPNITKKPISIQLGEEVQKNAFGFESYRFDKVGEYQITVEIKDTDGNSTLTDYKIKAVDTTKPQIVLEELVYAWEDCGVVSLPDPKIIDISAVDLQIDVKKNGAALEVTDGKVSAQVGDVLNAVYTVEDACGNTSQRETTIKIIPSGKLIDVRDGDANKVLVAKDGVMEFGEGLLYYCDNETDVLEWRNGAYAFDKTKEYAALSVSIKNTKSAKAEIAVYAKIAEEKLAVGNIDVLSMHTSSGVQEYIIPINNVSLKEIDGWRFEIKSTSSIYFVVTDISLKETYSRENAPSATDDALISFEAASAFEFSSAYNGGIVQNEDSNFVANGAKSARANIKANDSVGVLFKNKTKIEADANHVNLSLFAQRSGAVKIGLIVSGEEYCSAELELSNNGVNKKSFFIDARTLANFKDKTIDGIFIYNQEKYENTVYVDSISLQNKTELATEEIFSAPFEEYAIERTEKFVVPNIVICDSRLIGVVSVVNTLGTVELDTYTLGEEVDVSGLDSGTYALTYQVADIFGAPHTYSLSLIVKEVSLSGTVTFENYYTQEDILLPQPELSSSTYDADKLAEASIDKYYRMEGESGWTLVEGALRFNEPAYIDVKYIVTVDEYKISLFSNMYIHQKGVVMDYEKHIDGDYLGFRGHMYNSGSNKPYISSVWAKDGKYSLYVRHFTGWDDYNGVWEKRYYLSGYVDTVVFWAYSQWDMKPATLYFDDYSNQSVTGAVEIMPGEHRYVVKLSKPIDRFDRWWINVDKMHGFYIDSISMYNSADYEYQDIDGNRYAANGGAITFEKPKVTNVNTNLFTADEINNIKYYLEITNDTTTVKKTYEFTADQMQLTLEKGSYTVKYKVVIGGVEYFDVQGIAVKDLYASFIKPLTAINANTEYSFALPETEEGARVDAYISPYGENNWTALPVVGNYATVNLQSGRYQLKFTVTKGEATDEEVYSLTVRASNLIADFELDENGKHHGAIDNASGANYGHVSSEWAKDGDYSYYYNTGNHSKYEFKAEGKIELGGRYNALMVDAKVVRNTVYGATNLGAKLNGLEIELTTEVDGKLKSYTSKQVVMPQGENKYIFVFDIDFDNVKKFSFWTQYIHASSFYLDNITAVNVDLPELDESKNFVTVGSNIEILAAKTDVEGVVTEVSYGLYDGGEYISVTENAGKFIVPLTESGKYEILTKVKIGGNAFITRSTIINARSFSVSFIEPITTLHRNVEYEWRVYDSIEENVRVKVYLKKTTENEWQELSLNGNLFKLTLTDAEEYELKYEATDGTSTETEIYTLQSREENVLADFELTEDGTHYGLGVNSPSKLDDSCYITDAWSADGKYSYFFGYKAVSSVSFNYYDESKFNKENGWIRDGYRDLGGTYNAITMTIKANRQLLGYVSLGNGEFEQDEGIAVRLYLREADGTQREIRSNKILIPVGVDTYTFVFEESFEEIYGIGFGLHFWMATDFYVDAIKFDKIDYPEVPDSVDLGETITVNAVDFNEATITKVKYRYNGGTFYNLGAITESCQITATELGSMEIVIEININRTKVVLSRTVLIVDDPAADDLKWT